MASVEQRMEERREDGGASEQAEELEGRAESMEERSGELEREIAGRRRDWESKQSDESVPGAQTEAGAGMGDVAEGGESEEAAGDSDDREDSDGEGREAGGAGSWETEGFDQAEARSEGSREQGSSESSGDDREEQE